MKLKLHAFDLPLAHVFTISRESISVQPTLVVELADGGISGYGEATSNKYYGQSIANRMWSTPISIAVQSSAGVEKKPLVVT